MREMTEEQIERQSVEEVFRLTGGELDDHKMTFIDPDGKTRSWKYHYDGVPDYATSDFKPLLYENGYTWFTLVDVGVEYGYRAPEWLKFPDGSLALRVATYDNSGETECPIDNDGDHEAKVGAGSTEGMELCPLCEEKAGEDHGHIYLGPGAEHVYKVIDIECHACGILQSEIRVSGEGAACDCYDEPEQHGCAETRAACQPEGDHPNETPCSCTCHSENH